MTLNDILEFQNILDKRNIDFEPMFNLRMSYFQFPGNGKYYVKLFYNWGEHSENFSDFLSSANKHDINSAITGWFAGLEAVKAYNEDFGALDFEEFRKSKDVDETK